MAKAHPAKYSDVLLPIFEKELTGYAKVLDPFAGTGKLRLIRPDAYLLEIEPEWAEIRGAAVGNALHLPWPDDTFDAVCTSPCYGNRMADHHNAQDSSRRNTYRHLLERELHPANAGQLQWGHDYCHFHWQAWLEARRVLRAGGKFVLNISDHIRKGRTMPVTRFHKLMLLLLGFEFICDYKQATPRNRQGENGALRVGYESVLVFCLKKESGE